MRTSLGLGFCCVMTMLFLSCKHPSKNETAPVVASSASQIDSLIKAKEKKTYAVLTDTAKSNASGRDGSLYFSVTRFYYDKGTKELFKAENILQATAKTTFVAYYERGQVVKTTAHTEFGWYQDYFARNEPSDTASRKNEAGEKRKSPFRQQCWQLAREQQSIFQQKMG